MLKREKGLFVIYGIVVLILYLLSSTNLIIKEKKVEIYPISVIIEDTKDDYYQNFKKGMDQAARAFHVDTSFITLYEAHDWEQQMELLEREINDGARAVVLAPVDAEQTLLYLEEKKMVTPVILLGTNGSNDWVSDTISMDYFQAGEKLGTMFAEENPVDIPVYLFTEGLRYQSNQDFYDGVVSVLEPMGYQLFLYTSDSKDTFRRAIESTVYPESRQAAVIALDSPSLTVAADILEKSNVYRQQISNLYGIGSNVSLLNDLDSGIIRGMIVNNQFNAGYLSIQAAVEAIQMGIQKKQVVLDSFYIEKEHLRQPEYEKMLYPME